MPYSGQTSAQPSSVAPQTFSQAVPSTATANPSSLPSLASSGKLFCSAVPTVVICFSQSSSHWTDRTFGQTLSPFADLSVEWGFLIQMLFSLSTQFGLPEIDLLAASMLHLHPEYLPCFRLIKVGSGGCLLSGLEQGLDSQKLIVHFSSPLLC